MKSIGPGIFVEIVGTLQAAASMITDPNPSLRLGNKRMSNSQSQNNMHETNP